MFFSETVESYEIKVHTKAYGKMGMKIYTNELGHMTKTAKMAVMSIYSKHLKTFDSRNNGPMDLELDM